MELSKICADCDKKCLTCNATGCPQCQPGFKSINGSCINLCPDGKTPYHGECIKCAADNCNTCDHELLNCIDCKAGYFNQNGECVQTCQNGYYPDGAKCFPCMENCKSCTNRTSCDNCETNLFNGKCVDKCPVGMYSLCNGIVTYCQNCSIGCRTCDNSQTCKECATGYIAMKGGNCILPQNCPPGRFVDTKNNICKKCKVPFCQNCTDSSTCILCKNGYNLQNMICEENKTVTNVINYPRLFDQYSNNRKKNISVNSELNGVGIGSSELAISFWIRLITPEFAGFNDSKLFDTRVLNNNSTTFDYTSTKYL